MKIKGISIFEQHVEKAVVVLVGAAVLGALAWQFLGESTVEVGGRELPVADAFEPADREATAVTSAIEDPDPMLPEPPGISMAQALEAHLAERGAPRPDVFALGEGFGVEIRSGAPVPGPTGSEDLYAEINLPEPTSVVAGRYQGAIDPREVVTIPELASLLPAEQPFDTSAITVAGRFSGESLAARLTEVGAGRIAPPRAWTRDIELLAVELERQRLLPGGRWSEPEPVARAPRAVDLLEMVSDPSFARVNMPEVLDLARERRRAIAQPPFYRTLFSAAWTPPSEAPAEPEAMTGDEARIDELRRRIARLEADRAQLVERREELGGAGAGGGGRDTGAGGGGGRDRGRDDGRPPDRDSGQDNQRAIERINERIARVDSQIAELESELAALGVMPEADPNPDAPAGAGEADTSPLPELLDNESLRIWAHDLTAEPGATYRYRLRPVISNPYFGQPMPETQQQLADSPIIAGPWSDWTPPVELLRNAYYFAVSASEPNELGPARATFDLYRFYYGQWRNATAPIEPGDALMVSMEVPALPIFDMDRLAEAMQGRRPPPAPGEGDRRRDDRDRFGGGPDNRDAGRDNREDDAQLDPQLAALGGTLGPTSLEVDTGSVLLDVAADIPPSGAAGANVQVFLYDPDGAISQRRPATDRETPLYRQLRALVRASVVRLGAAADASDATTGN